MLNKLILAFFMMLTILSFYIPNLWMISILLFSLIVIELYYDNITIKVAK